MTRAAKFPISLENTALKKEGQKGCCLTKMGCKKDDSVSEATWLLHLEMLEEKDRGSYSYCHRKRIFGELVTEAEAHQGKKRRNAKAHEGAKPRKRKTTSLKMEGNHGGSNCRGVVRFVCMTTNDYAEQKGLTKTAEARVRALENSNLDLTCMYGKILGRQGARIEKPDVKAVKGVPRI